MTNVAAKTLAAADTFGMRQISKLQLFSVMLPSGRQIPSLVNPATGESPISLRPASQQVIQCNEDLVKGEENLK